MTSVCLYFQVHQPVRLRWFWPGDTGEDLHKLYFDDRVNEEVFHKVAGKCYWPTNQQILSMIDEHDGDFKLAYSITGTWLDQCREYDPELLDTFKQMARTGCVEFIDETYYHSLASLFEDKTEFKEEVKQHRRAMKDLLGVEPRAFRNTELLYNNSIARTAGDLGYEVILGEGIEWVLDGGRSPNHVYRARDADIRVLLRNYKLSDDIGYRFSAEWWNEWPLTADKWAAWAAATEGEVLNVFMDYETFGEHQWEDTGIFQFLEHLPREVLDYEHMDFRTPTEVVETYDPAGEIDVFDYATTSWADMERDPSAWLGNDMQRRCYEEIKHLEPYVKRLDDPEITRTWRYMLTSDHYYYMCTKWLSDGDVHSYFSHHNNPFDAAVNFMAVLIDFKARVFKRLAKREEE